MAEKLDGAELLTYFERLSNWHRWGDADELGTLNLITPAKRLAATRCASAGQAVTCARTISPRHSPDNPTPLLHFMTASGEAAGQGKYAVGDWIGMAIHGHGITHVDALAHESWNGKIYNGRPAASVTTTTGASVENIEVARHSIVTRGVYLDFPRWLGKDWLEPGYGITPEQVADCCAAQGVQVEAGDALLFRTGRDAMRAARGHYNPVKEGSAGLHASCLPWLHDRGIALLGSDGVNDVMPSGFQEIDMPIHAVGIVAMGLWLLDNCYFDDLSAACARHGRWEFLFVLSPLRLKNSTGSPVNPVALL